MGRHFAAIAFTDAVRAEQEALGSRAAYARVEQSGAVDDVLTAREAAYLGAARSLFVASVNADGWPYIQHRGGPAGFVQVLEGGRAFGFADLSGNRQHVTLGNLRGDDRVSLIVPDYLERRRLKLFGRARLVTREEDPALVARLAEAAGAPAGRALVIGVAGYDWNCPQHIPRLIPEEMVAETLGAAARRIAALEEELRQPVASRKPMPMTSPSTAPTA
ncbi:pyridoxamine 5'-phosphate oxidase family protein [Falsiroseomonas sp. HW251]|uniref:pyridoxamine 5'-phosphate oxidase family protein n=1 Tax=Falsiroseomonas sp. HW251 TaxID=3390998 RepID=UPI003D31B65E